MKLFFPRSKPAFLATSCSSSPQAPCHPTGPQQARTMLPALLLYWKAGCRTGTAVPGTQPLPSPCISSSPPSNSVWKLSGKTRQFHRRNVTLEVPTITDPATLSTRTVCLLHWLQWCNCAYWAITPSEIVPPVSICHSAIRFFSSCCGMLWHADKQLSSLTHEVAAWPWWVKAIPVHASCPCPGLENSLGWAILL